MLQSGGFCVLYTNRKHRQAAPKPKPMTSEEFNNEFLHLKDAALRYAVALLHNYAAAEDATQDLYEKLWRRRLLIRKNGFRALVMTSMRNLCLDRLRHKPFTPLENITTHPTSLPESDRDMVDLVQRIIDNLPDREREVIHLRDIEEFEYDQIATITGTSEAAARMACSRARNRIKEQLVKIINHGL